MILDLCWLFSAAVGLPVRMRAGLRWITRFLGRLLLAEVGALVSRGGAGVGALGLLPVGRIARRGERRDDLQIILGDKTTDRQLALDQHRQGRRLYPADRKILAISEAVSARQIHADQPIGAAASPRGIGQRIVFRAWLELLETPREWPPVSAKRSTSARRASSTRPLHRCSGKSAPLRGPRRLRPRRGPPWDSKGSSRRPETDRASFRRRSEASR